MTSDSGVPELRMPPGDARTAERLLQHYRVEKRLADALRASSRDERAAIYARMYDELFAAVPDHPRLTRREDPEATRIANVKKMQLLRHFMGPDSIVGEFGAGDCRFSIEIAAYASKVYAIDIAEQSGGAADEVDNLEQVIYDGAVLPIPDDTLDVMISDQLLEHLHPDDVGLHLEMVHRVLRPGGVYLIRTPHALTGPHDISKYFSEVAQGFHLKEWTYSDLLPELASAGYSSARPFRTYGQRTMHPSSAFLKTSERLVMSLPRGMRLRAAHVLLKEVCVAAYK